MNLLDGVTVRPSGEGAVVLELGDTVDGALHDRVLAVDAAVARAGLPGVLETVPTYRSVLLRLDPERTTPDEVVAALATLTVQRGADVRGTVSVPVTFDGDDLPTVAERCGVTSTEVVRLLTSDAHRLYQYGFAPGFAYLGDVPAVLHLPRRATPRAPVPPGSVLLAAGQLALCPVAMPTGWWVVGRTDVVLFDPEATPPVPFVPGTSVRLTAVGS